MKLFRGLETVPAIFAENGTVATIGNFDGVHKGHQALLAQLRTQAKAYQLPLVVFLFEPQPSEFFYGQNAPVRLSSLREKLALLSSCQVDFVFCLKFNEKLAKLSAPAFAKKYFFTSLQVKYLLVGEDFRFGFQRTGNIELLQAIGVEKNCKVEVFPDFYINDERVSSTRVRQALAQGDFKLVSTLLGRNFSLCGPVIRGEGRGRQWGIPTANLNLLRPSLPLSGVFCVEVFVKGTKFFGAANIGTRPTVNGMKSRLEVHLLDCNQDLYGEMLEVIFLKKLREEVKFYSVEDLINQIKQDIFSTRAFFSKEI